jgi:hypothetical protein
MVDEIAERDDLPRLRKPGLAVLDLDQKDGKDGQTTLRVLELENGLLPPTLTQRTTSGGTHLIFNGKIKTTVGAEGYALGEDIDTRGKGGMIVLAPTKLANGQYEWLNDLEPVELPQRVADLAGTVPERNAAPETKLRRPIRMRNLPSGSIRSRSKNTMASMIFDLN